MKLLPTVNCVSLPSEDLHDPIIANFVNMSSIYQTIWMTISIQASHSFNALANFVLSSLNVSVDLNNSTNVNPSCELTKSL